MSVSARLSKLERALTGGDDGCCGHLRVWFSHDENFEPQPPIESQEPCCLINKPFVLRVIYADWRTDDTKWDK
jgi:hypothetical protein